MTSAEIDAIFTTLGRRLPGLIQEVIELQAQRPPLEITGRFAPSKQRQLAVEVMKAIGFPFDRGRLDESEHPFTGGVPGDIRITTRFSPTDPLTGLMGVLHETGHAMYDVGLPEAWRGQPVGRDRGMAMQESQSLLLEMLICRNRPFLRYLKPLLEKAFGVSGPGMGSGESVSAADPRASQPDSRRCGRGDVSGAHHAALRARERRS